MALLSKDGEVYWGEVLGMSAGSSCFVPLRVPVGRLVGGLASSLASSIACGAILLLAGGAGDPAQAAPKFPNRVIVEAEAYPWSALGRVNTGGRGFCTGTLVSDRHVLTRARCLYNAVEGRWWDATELHFVAGYERDSYRLNAPVVDYRVARGYAGGLEVTLADVLNNWALLTLDASIGREAGWMKVQWLDSGTLDRIKRGDVQILDAGYRRGQAHVVTVTLSCSVDGALRRRLLSDRACTSTLYDPGLSTLLFIDGELRVLGSRSMRKDTGFRNMSARFAPGAQRSGGGMLRDTVSRLFGAVEKRRAVSFAPRSVPLPAAKPLPGSVRLAENGDAGIPASTDGADGVVPAAYSEGGASVGTSSSRSKPRPFNRRGGTPDEGARLDWLPVRVGLD